jgi:Flp pilus assembly protein TadD
VTLGVLLATQGRFDQAIAQFDEALRQDPSNPIARSNLDRIRSQMAPD